MDLMARNPSNTTLEGIWYRVLNISQGAAMMTGTLIEVTDIGSDANIIGNDALAPLAQKNLEEVGGYTLSLNSSRQSRLISNTSSLEKPTNRRSPNVSNRPSITEIISFRGRERSSRYEFCEKFSCMRILRVVVRQKFLPINPLFQAGNSANTATQLYFFRVVIWRQLRPISGIRTAMNVMTMISIAKPASLCLFHKGMG